MADKFKSWRWLLLVVLIASLFPSTYASENNNASVIVVQKDNGKPLSDATITIVPLQNSNNPAKVITGATDQSGAFAYSFTQPVIIQISHLGYSTITDTVLVLNNKTYSLTTSVQNIKDAVITGQYAPTNIHNSVYEVKVINSDMIRAKGANNLREAVQNELGIDLGQDQIFGSNVGINGISGEGVKIMVDGVPLVGRLDGKLDLSQITLNNIDRIEIVEGPLSVMYGTDAMGGVINVITKNFQKEKININLKGYYESVGQYNVELNTGFAFKKNQVYLSGGRNFFNGYSAIDTIPRVKDWFPKEQYFADAKYIYNANKFRFTMAASFFRELMLDRGAPNRTLENNSTTWTYLANDIHFLTYRPRVSASMMYRFKENSQLDVLLAYSGFFRFDQYYTKNLVTLNEQKTSQDTTFYHDILFRGTYSLPAWKNRLNFLFGLEANQEYTYENRILGNRQQLGDYAAFGSVRIKLVEGLDVLPAIRFSYNTKFQVPLIPSINLRYNYKDKLVFRASYGRGYRAPTLKELYLNFFDSNHALKGNDQLKPEDGHCVNSSISYTLPVAKEHNITFAAAGFYNHINNKIDFVFIPAPFPPDTYQYANLKKYITYGGNVSLGYQWKRLNLKASGQLTHYQLSILGNQSNEIKMLSPDFTASASYLIPKAEIGINIHYKYTGAKPLYSLSGSYESGKQYAYNWLDVSLTRNFWKDRIQLTVGGKNLVAVKNIQKSSEVIIGHDADPNSANIGWGRTFFTSLVLHFSK